ncbi:acyl-coenzyme A thioesterase 8 [Betta splendens]|uniref:Acyl-coenzyme A thioesterase 8 n=1 Tax=Betta splendens TaxID=158456 RepID=A0A6P7MM62_BETSP|nr:acyl-coenzyme A thioesterase 8 [Betta splendens]XP_029007900.1 acyl-coenzyme A thioesterase 8 [Betta splendens]XP_029007901.1 acyl-coenzyme A thioesterase 8 [Betta splendens]XP_055364805.1 acyl-coenzyme A thioesterase 8 [Betta splendens]
MVETGMKGVGGSVCPSPVGNKSPNSGAEKSPEEPKVQFKQDLKSVLVTSVLNLEELDVDLYRGTHHWVPRTQRLFGGQIVGQALVAAAKSVNDNLYAHSLHCYFVRAGDPKVPVLYQVERTRNGRSFTVRSVKAIQHGQPILICQASFQMIQPSPLEHQFTMPVVPQPEDLSTVEELIRIHLSKPDLAEKLRQGLNKLLANEVPIEIKPVQPKLFSNFFKAVPKKLFWVRARGYIGEGNMKLHCCVAAYVSDYAFLDTALLPSPKYRAQFSASLDHAMWFHTTFRSDEWMLYECESPWAGGCRGLVQGRLWRRDGVLAVSCSQEGVLRVKLSKL